MTALSKASSVRICEGRKSSQTISTTRLPVAVAICEWRESGAGMEEAPGSVRPSASTALIIVAAVPIVMQVPGERAIPCSRSSHCCWSMVPARSSDQPLNMSVPEPSVLPEALPLSIGPAGMKMNGRSIEIAPIASPGVVLSHPPMRTAPSTG